MTAALRRPRLWLGLLPFVVLVVIRQGFEIAGNLAHLVADVVDTAAAPLGAWMGLPQYWWGR